ncbi:MAG: HAD-IIIA family hydrolase [Acidaminococcales bacterium]|jgi:histidinol-phosphate phosphatase family protein|nr:HAD-IIIA family hydrolase [Acidaminococcales bacterium]
MSFVKAAVLAGGKGTRIGQLFPDLPKPMMPVCGKPLLQWQVESLVTQGIRDITLIIGYKANVIRNHFGDGKRFGARIGCIFEKEPLGTGGALTLLPREDTLILFGDVYCDVDYSRFFAFHKEHGAEITLFAHPNSHPHDSDIVVTDGENRVVAWKSKKYRQRGEQRNLVNSGLYVFSGGSLPSGEAAKRDLEHDLIIPNLTSGKVYAYRSTEYVKDMGTPERLSAVERDIESGITAAKCLKNKQRAVFIDRDGTLNEENGFITSPEQLRLIPGAAEAVRMLNRSPYLAICVTNQAVIARGDVSFEGLEAIHARLDVLLGQEGAYLDDLLFCPHHPDKGYAGEVPKYKIDCDCRKPKPGMLLEAARRYNIDLSRSYMIGDSTADIAAGQASGCKTIGVRTGMALTDGKNDVEPDLMCENLSDAVGQILMGKTI